MNKKQIKRTVRQSQFELIRIISMLFILCHHLVIKGADTCGYLSDYVFAKDGYAGLLINGLVVGGVNVFVLISGYFGIHHTWKAIVRLIVDLIVFDIIAYVGASLLFGVDYSLKGLIHGIDIHNWFVLSYGILVLLAPMLELVLKDLDRRTLGKFIIVLLVINVFFGWYWRVVNENGYNYVNFIMLYFIARYIRLAQDSPSSSLIIRHIQKFGFVYWIFSGIALMAVYLLMARYNKAPESVRWFGYNNPFVILSAVSIFICMSSVKFYNRWVNLFATGIFGVFLLHTQPQIITVRNQFAHSIYLQYGYPGIIILALFLLIGLSCISIPVEKMNGKIVSRLCQFMVKG